MRRAALPWGRIGPILLGLLIAAVLAVSPAGAGSSAGSVSAGGQIWALALPDSLGSVRGDTQPPSVPQGMAFAGRSRTSVSLVWRAATDNVGVRGYRLFRNGVSVATVSRLGYTYRGLRCGTSYTFALEAYDAAGNTSYRPEAVGTTSTAPCSSPSIPPSRPKQPTRPTPPRSVLANVWVDTNGGSCRRRATASAYVDAQACGTLTSAYNGSSAGDTIMVTAGTYGRQVIPAGTKKLTIRNASGTKPVFGTTAVNASNITMIGIRIRRNDDPGADSATLEAKGANNTFNGVHVDTRNAPVRQGIYAHGDKNLFRNGSSANVVDEKGVLVGGTGITFDNFDFHDVRVTNETVHNECVYSIGPNLTVRNSRFWNCATMDLFITRGNWWGQPLYGGITLENNIFGHSTMEGPGSWHYYGLGINGGVIKEMRNWRVVNNTFETEVSGGGTPAPGTIWANNVGSWSCYPGATFSHNVGEKCSDSDKAVSPAASCGRPACPNPTTAAQGWVNPASHDFRLTANSRAINAGDPAYAPATDKSGKARSGGRPDAGAYEYRPPSR